MGGVGAGPACGTNAKSKRATWIGGPGAPLNDVSHAGEFEGRYSLAAKAPGCKPGTLDTTVVRVHPVSPWLADVPSDTAGRGGLR